MSCFKLPHELISKLTSAISKFWWSPNGKDRGIHWVAWDKMCKPKIEGGVGFRSLEHFNSAMLAKQYWRLIQYPKSLVARVMKGRYYSKVDPLRATKPYSPSFGWRSIFSAKELLEKGVRWGLGSGVNLSVWHDPWIPDIYPRPANGRGRLIHPNLKVNHLINHATMDWHLPILQEYMEPEDIQLIKSMAISKNYKPNRILWHFTKSGKYTVKSGCRVLYEMKETTEVGPNYNALKAKAWKVKVPPKIQHFIWQIASGALAVTSRLIQRGVQCENVCKRCGEMDESINHALFECPYSVHIWELSSIPVIAGIFPTRSVFTNLDYLFWRLPPLGDEQDDYNIFPWLLWLIWKSRNNKVFQGIQEEPSDIINHAKREQMLWKEAQLITNVENEVPLTHQSSPRISSCKVDGSWKSTDPTSGLGWIYSQGEASLTLLGAKCQRKSLSPLHSELEALIWAMECILLRRIDCQVFETDCAELVSMVSSPEEWPAFSTLLDEFGLLRDCFTTFSLSRIPRSDNLQADCLARSSRTLSSDTSFVNNFPPVWATNLGVTF